MSGPVWSADPTAAFARRLGIPPQAPGSGGGGDGTASGEDGGCPDIWELSNGDVAVIGRDLTGAYQRRLPDGVSVGADERLVIIPRGMIIAAKAHIPDARLLDAITGERLLGEDYQKSFERDFWQTDHLGFWKLERRQEFQEPTSPSWRAFAAGDWAEATRLTEARRGALTDYYRRIADHGFTTRRVRVVERPLTPYLRWELHLLRLRDELGGAVRVVGDDQVAALETVRPLPEVITLGSAVLYEILYDEDGRQLGGVRCADREVVRRWRTLIQDLYRTGEAVASFVDREVVLLTSPSDQ